MRKSQISPKKSIPSYIIIKLKKKQNYRQRKNLESRQRKKDTWKFTVI